MNASIVIEKDELKGCPTRYEIKILCNMGNFEWHTFFWDEDEAIKCVEDICEGGQP